MRRIVSTSRISWVEMSTTKKDAARITSREMWRTKQTIAQKQHMKCTIRKCAKRRQLENRYVNGIFGRMGKAGYRRRWRNRASIFRAQGIRHGLNSTEDCWGGSQINFIPSEHDVLGLSASTVRSKIGWIRLFHLSVCRTTSINPTRDGEFF